MSELPSRESLPVHNGAPGNEFLRVIRTVASALFGVRGKALHERDSKGLSPLHVLAVAIAFMIMFVATLVTLASFVAGA